MKTFKELVNEAKAPKKTKLRYKYFSAFRAGMHDGSQFTALGVKEKPEIAAIKSGYGMKATDTKMYVAGYALGSTPKYIKVYKENKLGRDQVRVAIADGDVDNVDFSIDFNGSVVDKYKE